MCVVESVVWHGGLRSAICLFDKRLVIVVVFKGRPSDERPTCPPPITAERARQNVPSASSYMSLKHSRPAHSGSNELPDTTGSSTIHQRIHDNDTSTQSGQRKKVRHFDYVMQRCTFWLDAKMSGS